MQENVGDLEIAMHSFDLVQSLKAINELFEEVGCLVLCQSFLFLQIFLEIASIAVLHDDAHALVGEEVIDKSDDILIFALPEYSNFSLHEFF